MQKFLTGLPLATLMIIYIYACGAIYLVSFWSTFDIDISPFMSLNDIPKSFLFPALLFEAPFIVYFIPLTAINSGYLNRKFSGWVTTKDYSNWKTTIDLAFIMAALIVFFLPENLHEKDLFWYTSSVVLAFLAAMKGFFSSSVQNIIKPHFPRLYVCLVICILPIVGIGMGKVRSSSVYENKQIKYLKNIAMKSNHAIMDTTFFKLLGFIGDKLIISSLDNSRVIVINQSDYESVEFRDGEMVEDTIKRKK